MGKFIRKNLSLFIFVFIGASLVAYSVYENKFFKKANRIELAFSQAEINAEKQAQDSKEQDRLKEEAEKEKQRLLEEANKKPYKTLPPVITAKAYSVIDLTHDTLMFDQSADLSLPPASVSKIMTAIIALENYDLAKAVTVPEKCTKVNASRVGFKPNESYTLEDMLYGLLVKSGADAACSIAYITNENDFISKMNEKAKLLELNSTNFQNEIGLDSDTENKQLSSVNDIVKMSKYALKSSIFRKIIGTKKVTLKSITGNHVIDIQNTNDLLFTIPGSVGIKTGNTDAAKGCLAYLYENKGQEVLIVILGSDDRFSDTKSLLEWSLKEITGESNPLNINSISSQPVIVSPQSTLPILPGQPIIPAGTTNSGSTASSTSTSPVIPNKPQVPLE